MAPDRLTAQRRASVEANVSKGREALEAGRLEESIERLRAALGDDPAHVPAALSLAQAYERAKKPVFAVRAYLLAARFLPKEPKALFAAARLAAASGRFGQAVQILRRVVRRFPNELAARADLARLELGFGQHELAANTALALIDAAQAPEQRVWLAEGHLLAGLAFMLSSKSTYAEKHLLEARRIAPDSVDTWLALAKLKLLQKDRVKAERILLDAHERFPRASGPANELGLLCLGAKAAEKRARAVGYFEAAARAEPKNADVYLNLALAWVETNEDRARWCLERARRSKNATVRERAEGLIKKLAS